MIYSRHRYDYRECSCESVAVDGGIECERIIGSEYTMVMFQLDRKIRIEDLEKDFRSNQISDGPGDVFGKICRADQGGYTFFVKE